jgi:hypothetical protein
MKYDDMIKDQGPGIMSLLQAMANTTPMAQVIILTIDGRRVAFLGPVTHAPHAGLQVGDVQEVEFGEIIPMALAAQLMSGEFAKGQGVQ